MKNPYQQILSNKKSVVTLNGGFILFLRINHRHIPRILHQPFPTRFVEAIEIPQQGHVSVFKLQIEILDLLKFLVWNRQLDGSDAESLGNAAEFSCSRTVALLQLPAEFTDRTQTCQL